MKLLMSKRYFLKKLIPSLTLFPVLTSYASSNKDVIESPQSKRYTIESIKQYISLFIGECVFISGQEATQDDSFFYSGYFVSIPVIADELIDNVIYIRGKNCTWKRKIDDFIDVSWFGAIGDGINDDSNAISRANIAAHNECLPLKFIPGHIYQVKKTYEIDVSKTSWFSSDLSTLKWFNDFNADFAIRLFSSQKDYSKRFQNVKVAIKSIAIIGAGIKNLLDSCAIKIGGDERNSSLFTIDSVSIQGWRTTLAFDNNSWRIKFCDCHFLWGNIIAPPGNKNSGECMVFDNCMFADNRSYTELHYGDWFFSKCSFDNHEVKLFGDANVFINQSHMENPGRKTTDFTIVSINSINSFASVIDSFIFISPTPKIINTPLFYVISDNENGLYVRNLRFQATENYNPSKGTENALVLVGGDGKSYLENVRVSLNNKSYLALNKNDSSVLMNSRFKDGLRYWDFNDGVSLQARISSNDSETIVFSKNGASLSQSVLVKSTGILSGGMMLKIVSGDLKLTLECYDSLDNNITTREWNCSATDYSDWSWVRFGEKLPDNIRKIKFYCKSFGQSVDVKLSTILMDIIS
ncbi:TPA: hypothetical protein MYN68_001222 [Klebsiella pneumoniae]|nr:hypothetical protein [Klebsiella pneumoniae]